MESKKTHNDNGGQDHDENDVIPTMVMTMMVAMTTMTTPHGCYPNPDSPRLALNSTKSGCHPGLLSK
eukprot:4429881-Karenia_brevis.AAC.1